MSLVSAEFAPSGNQLQSIASLMTEVIRVRNRLHVTLVIFQITALVVNYAAFFESYFPYEGVNYLPYSNAFKHLPFII